MSNYEAAVSTAFICPIVNDDLSGLEESDCVAYQQWLDAIPYQSYYITYDDGDDEWNQCEITGLMGDCAIVRINHN